MMDIPDRLAYATQSSGFITQNMNCQYKPAISQLRRLSKDTCKNMPALYNAPMS